jgi:hypothetical protein
MAKRPDISEDAPLSSDEIARLRQRLSQMNENDLTNFYLATWNQCKLKPWGKPPKIRFLQELVQAWRTLKRRGTNGGLRPEDLRD